MKKESNIIRSIRREFAFWGLDLSHLTDEEIEQRSVEGARMVAKAGVTMQEACDSLAKAMKQLKNAT